MANYRTLRSAPWLTPHALGHMAVALAPLGYTLASTTPTSIVLKFAGSYFTTTDTQAPHGLCITLVTGGVHFEFRCTWAVFLTGNEKAIFEARASQALQFLYQAYASQQQQVVVHVHAAAPQYYAQHQPAQHVIERQVMVVRCRYCQRITAVDLAGCANCGAANFS